MEKLLSNVKSEVFPDKQTKDIYLCPSTTIDVLAEQITPTSPNFGLVLAMDAQSIDSGQIGELAEKMADKGLAYLCAWGPDCEQSCKEWIVAPIGNDESEQTIRELHFRCRERAATVNRNPHIHATHTSH